MLNSIGANARENAEDDYHEQIQQLFIKLFLNDKLLENDYNLVTKLLGSSLPWHDECLLVTALTLGLNRCFDEKKLLLLANISAGNNNQVWQRALVGLVLMLEKYDYRLYLYPKTAARIKTLSDQKEWKQSFELTVMQYLKSKDTEEVTRKIREDLLPEMMKYRSKFEDKLDLENILSASEDEDKNPDWQEVFKDSPGLYDKFEEFSLLQIEGADVFMSAFAMLKQFSFFNKISNWFLPFYKENRVLSEALEGAKKSVDTQLFRNGLERSHVLCNSDKYSFCLNIRHMPEVQKTW
ncbi:MAG: hypothetical protein HC896_07395 [Bacteroidales bacterium]|nr:hypothetical protein [Bacteroidales bacterium]